MCLCTAEPSWACTPDPVWVELSLRLGDFDGFRESPSVCEASIQMEGAQCSTVGPAKQKPLEVAKWGLVPHFLDFLWAWLGLARAWLCVEKKSQG